MYAGNTATIRDEAHLIFIPDHANPVKRYAMWIQMGLDGQNSANRMVCFNVLMAVLYPSSSGLTRLT